MRRSSACAAHAHLSTEPLHLLTFLSLLACRRRWALAFGGVSTAALLLIGACAGAAGQASAHPLDVVRRRMQMQGVGKAGGRVLILAATNTPYQLDQAVRRRFDKRIYIPLPDEHARAHMFKVHVGETPHELTDADFQSLGAQSEGFSGSDIDHVVKDVLYEPVRKVQEATHFKTMPQADGSEQYVPCSPGDPQAWASSLEQLADLGYAAKVMPPNITANDFRKVLLRARPTVAKEDLEVLSH